MITNSRLYQLLLLAGFSLAVAVACFFVGGYIAEASSAEPIMGITFKAGGALAGFLITFITLFAAYRKLGIGIPPLKVSVSPPKGSFPHSGDPYSVQVTIMKYATGRTQAHVGVIIWESGGLMVHLRNIEENDLVMVAITDNQGKTWSSDFFSPLRSSQKLN